MLVNRRTAIAFTVFCFVIAWSTESLAGSKLYEGSWIAESFGNDKANIGTEESQYFEILAIPQGLNCHPEAPLCNITSTPVTTTGTSLAPGANGSLWNPLGPGCRPLTAGEKPRPARHGTATTLGGSCPYVAPPNAVPCNKTPPLYRNTAFFTAGGSASNATCEADQTVALGKTTVYLGPGNPLRGKAMKGAPLTGSQDATTTGTSFKFPAAPATPTPGSGFRRTTVGSFIGEGPYLYSYTYANLRNDAGDFGPGKGFFSTGAGVSTLQFPNKAGGTTVANIKVTKGSNSFGGVMKLLGTYTNKVCYFYGGGCGLGYGTWGYQFIGAAGYKDSKTPSVVTDSWTTGFEQIYYNTGLGTFAKYDVIEQRFPWTTGTVTVTATGRGPNKTFEQRKGFDNRTATDGLGTVQLVSPLLTQWLGQFGNSAKFESGGIGVMQIKFIPEPGAMASLFAGVSMLLVLGRFRR